MAHVSGSDSCTSYRPDGVQDYRDGQMRPPQKYKIPFDVKRLQCWYWTYHGKCCWGNQCRYAHFETGRIADRPIHAENGFSVAGRNATVERPIYRKWQGQTYPQQSSFENDRKVRRGAGYTSSEHWSADSLPHGRDERKLELPHSSSKSRSRYQRESGRSRSRSPTQAGRFNISVKDRSHSRSGTWSPQSEVHGQLVDKQSGLKEGNRVKVEPVAEKDKRDSFLLSETFSSNKHGISSHHIPNTVAPAATLNSKDMTFENAMGNPEYSDMGHADEDPRADFHGMPAFPATTQAHHRNLVHRIHSHRDGVPSPENSQMTITVGEWSSIQDEIAESKQQIEEQRCEILLARQTLETYRFMVDKASSVLDVGVDALSNHGFLAMNICQKIQRGEAISNDEVTDTWLNANELLRQADRFLHLQAQWSRLSEPIGPFSNHGHEGSLGSRVTDTQVFYAGQDPANESSSTENRPLTQPHNEHATAENGNVHRYHGN